MTYTIKKVADLAGITVRTLHYYDEIGLLTPTINQENGYREYSEQDLLKLQQILFFRELEFPLEQIQDIMGDSTFNAISALEEQKQLLQIKRKRLDALLQTIDATIKKRKGGESMSDDQVFGGFDENQMEEYKEEAKMRWGNTKAWKQSQERTKNWRKEDYKRIAKEGLDWTKKFAELRDNGLSHDSHEVQVMIEEHYNSLRMFYEPTLELYQGLGEMYASDPRFTAYYDQFGEGLAVFMRDAMLVFINLQGKK